MSVLKIWILFVDFYSPPNNCLRSLDFVIVDWYNIQNSLRNIYFVSGQSQCYQNSTLTYRAELFLEVSGLGVAFVSLVRLFDTILMIGLFPDKIQTSLIYRLNPFFHMTKSILCARSFVDGNVSIVLTVSNYRRKFYGSVFLRF